MQSEPFSIAVRNLGHVLSSYRQSVSLCGWLSKYARSSVWNEPLIVACARGEKENFAMYCSVSWLLSLTTPSVTFAGVSRRSDSI